MAGDIRTTNNLNLLSTAAGGASGVITMDGGRFIHDYTMNKTFGRNQFMGFGAGNFTLGSSTQLFSGIDNLGIGKNALTSLTEGSNNVAVGPDALANTTTGGSNVAVGWNVLASNTSGGGNSAVGRSAMQSNTDGRFNSAFGNSALEDNISGENNVALGAFALSNSTANNNAAFGYGAGSTIISGEANTIVGFDSGNGITTGGYNTIIGANVSGLSSSLSNNVIIADGNGNQRINVDSSGNVGLGTSTPSERLTVVGTIQSTTLLGGSTNLTTDAAGNIIRDPSDARLKENVVTIENALDTVLSLRGVRYEWIDKERFGDQFEIGFIAQEVDVLVPEVVQKGGEYWSLNSKNLIAVVVEAMKEMWVAVSGHEERLVELEIENSELRARLEAVEAELINDGGDTPVPSPEPTPAPEEGSDNGGEGETEPAPDSEPNEEVSTEPEPVVPDTPAIEGPDPAEVTEGG